jgi:hypothetical protein
LLWQCGGCVGAGTQVPRHPDVVHVVAKPVQLKAPVQVVMGLSTMQALLGPGGGVVTQTPLWTPLGGGGSGGRRLVGRDGGEGGSHRWGCRSAAPGS